MLFTSEKKGVVDSCWRLQNRHSEAVFSRGPSPEDTLKARVGWFYLSRKKMVG
jgi:hypothetical protein